MDPANLLTQFREWLAESRRNQLLTAGAAAAGGILAILVVVIAVSGDGGEGEQHASPLVQTSPSASPTTHGTPPGSSPGATPRVVFLRPVQTNYEPPTGVLYVSDLDGSNPVQVTPGNMEASFAGIDQNDSETILYYVAVDPSGANYTLYSRELNSGKVSDLLAIGSALLDFAQPPSATLSDDGAYIAIAESEGIDVVKLDSGERSPVLSNDVTGCRAGPISQCYSYRAPIWSPDGRLLMVTKGEYEGSVVVVADSGAEGEEAVLAQPFAGGWSPASDSTCTFFGPPGLYGPGGIYLYSSPDWEARTLLGEYEAATPGAEFNYRSVSQCQWLDGQRIVFATAVSRPRGAGEDVNYTLSLYDLPADRPEPLIELAVHPAQTWVQPPQLFPVGGTETLVVDDFATKRPVLISIGSGSSTPILQEGDIVVSVTHPLSLAADVSSATPPQAPCSLLAAHCEARVVGVGADKLNVRDAPSQGTVIRQLAEGDSVCLGESFALAENYRWWPVSGEPASYVAQGDPQAQTAWLEPTGRAC